MLKTMKNLVKYLVKTCVAILVTVIIALLIAYVCKPENRKETIQFLDKFGVLDVAEAVAPESEEIQKAKLEADIYNYMDAVDEYYEEEEATVEEQIIYEITKDAAEEYVDDFVQNYYAEDSYEEEYYEEEDLESQSACWSIESVNDEYFIGEVNQMVLAGVIRESVVTDWQNGLMSDEEFVNYINEYYPCYIEMINAQ